MIPTGDVERMDANTSDSRMPEAWDQPWDGTIRAACRMIAEVPGGVKSIHIVGEAWPSVEPRRLQRFMELAQSAAEDFGVVATVGFEHRHPCLHLAHRPRSDWPRRVGLNTEADQT